jgi:hypothetical protein
MTDVIRHHLNRAKQRMKRQADEHRSERQFQMGDLVFVKIQPYIQSSLAQRTNQKLSFKFFGPYRVLARVGTVAYRLELPVSSSVHPIFHVSQLKKSVGAHHSVTAHLPSEAVLWSVPEKILRTRTIFKGTHSITQGLIKWSNLSSSLSTWEDLEFLKQQFPRASVWSRPGAQGGGDVTAPTIQHPTTEDEEATLGPGPQPARRSTRPRTRSTRVMGEDWVPA